MGIPISRQTNSKRGFAWPLNGRFGRPPAGPGRAEMTGRFNLAVCLFVCLCLSVYLTQNFVSVSGSVSASVSSPLAGSLGYGLVCPWLHHQVRRQRRRRGVWGRGEWGRREGEWGGEVEGGKRGHGHARGRKGKKSRNGR
jgi:hypothetical protein